MGKERIRKKIKAHFNSLVIATFSAWKKGKRSPTNGMIEPLLSYFGKLSDEIILIDNPHPGSDDIIPKIDYYKNNTFIKRETPRFLFPPLFVLKKNNSIKTQPTFKIRDIVTVFQVLQQSKNKIDLFIGLESINTLVGILFKKFGKVKTVVYYVSDYSPVRYPSKIFNSFYLLLDRFCVTHADYIWDVSKAMMPARIDAGLKQESAKPVIHVPNALFPSQIKFLPLEKVNIYNIAFAGTIGPENGLDLAIEAFAIARKKYPKLRLQILGSGLKKDEDLVKSLIKKLKLQDSVVYHGFISDLEKLTDILMHCSIGLAPYRSIPWSVRWYADATKMRLYFANGLPAITTQVPPLGKEAEEKGCAIVTIDSKEEFAKTLTDVLSDKKLYKKMRNSAILFAKNNTWQNTYSNALKKMSHV